MKKFTQFLALSLIIMVLVFLVNQFRVRYFLRQQVSQGVTALDRSSQSWQEWQAAAAQQNLSFVIYNQQGLAVQQNVADQRLLLPADLNYYQQFLQAKQVDESYPMSEKAVWWLQAQEIKERDRTLGMIVVAVKDQPVPAQPIEPKLMRALSEIKTYLLFDGRDIVVQGLDLYQLSLVDSYVVLDQQGQILSQQGSLPIKTNMNLIKATAEKNSFFINLSGKQSQRFAQIAKSLPEKNGADLNTAQIYTIFLFQPALSWQRELGWLLVTALITAGLIIVITQKKQKKVIYQVNFDQETGLLQLEENQLREKKIKIPLDTNQYYVLKALWQDPEKKWANDELVDQVFGEDVDVKEHTKKIYDAVRAINQKIDLEGQNVIENRGKNYFFHPSISIVNTNDSP